MEFNKKNIRAISSLIILAAALLWATFYFNNVIGFFKFIYSVIFPFLLGGAIAFVVNVLLDKLEGLYTKLFIENKKDPKLALKLRRGLCLTVSLIVILGIVFALLFLIVPEVINSIKMVIDSFPSYMANAQKIYTDLKMQYNLDFLPQWGFKLDWLNLSKEATTWITNYGQSILNNTMSAANTVMGTFITLFLAIVFSVYILAQKETLKIQFEKVLYAYFNFSIVNRIKHIGQIASQTFANFITGQLIECLLLGVVCFVGMLIMKMPYAPMVSALVAFGALIPVFGATIATLLGGLLIMLVNPMQGLAFIAFIVIYQQIDGNIIYPRIVGNSVGLPGIWVLAAVTLGGNIAGMLGMLIGVPVFSVIYALFREDVYKQLITKELVNEDHSLNVEDPLVIVKDNNDSEEVNA